jgi:hypothetical protein
MLLAMYILNPFRFTVPYLDYTIHYKYISTVLCENKDKPMMHCNGKCYLKKQLSQASTQETQSTSSNSYKILQEEIQTKNYYFSFVSYNPMKLSDFYFYSEKIPSGFLKQPTPPPQLG